MTVISWVRFGLKLLELVLACVCIGIFANTELHHVIDEYYVEITTYGGYIIILSGSILGYLTGEHMPRKMDLLLTVLGAALFVASGSMRVHGVTHHPEKFQPEHLSNACGGIAIFNAFVFGADALLWVRDVNEYTPH